MMDALALAVEEGVDAIVDIATLTGAALLSLGQSTAPLFGNDRCSWRVSRTRPQRWTSRCGAAAGAEVPQAARLRDRRHLQPRRTVCRVDDGALFLQEFVGETPWAHIDIAGTMQSDTDDVWRPKGATGFGARMLAELARGFSPGS